MTVKITAILLLLGLSLSGCYYDVAEELYGAKTCDTTHTTYSVTITGIINNYACLSCHSGVSPQGGFSLQTYADVKAKVLDNRLWGAINHTTGFAAMPQGMAKMSPCDINKIKAWIDAGAP